MNWIDRRGTNNYLTPAPTFDKSSQDQFLNFF